MKYLTRNLLFVAASAGALCLPATAETTPPPERNLLSFYDGQVIVRAAESGQWQWHPLAIGNGGHNLGLTFAPSDAERIYLRSDVSGIIRSENGGENWMTSNIGLQGLARGNYGVGAIAVDPVNPARVYASMARTYDYPSGIVRSDDYGESWEFISPQVAIYGEGARARKSGGPGILIDPRQTSRLYSINSLSNDGAGGVWTSSDYGQSWSPTGLDKARINTLRFHPANPDTLYASAINHPQSAGGMFRSDDGGATWQRIGLDGKEVYNFNFEQSNPDILYASTGLEGIYKSTDGGHTWQAANSGLPLAADGHKGQYFDYHWRGLDTSPHTPGHLIASADVIRAIYESRDYGQTWQRLPFTQMNTPEGWMLSPHHMGWHTTNVYFHPDTPDAILSCDFFATWRSDDGGRTWRTNPYGAENACMVTVLPDVQEPNRYYIGLWDHDMIIHHDDPQQPWTQRVGGARQDSRGTNHHASAIAQNAAQPEQMLAVMNSAALIYSANRGQSWARITEGLPEDTYWRMGFPVIAAEAQLAFLPLGTDTQETAGNDGIYVSRDNGLSWERATNQNLPVIDVSGRWDPRQNVFAGTQDAGLLALVSKGNLHLSADRAESWTAPALPLNPLNHAPLKASRVAVEPDATAIFVGMQDGGGLWRALPDGSQWTQLWQPQSGVNIDLLAIDPTDADRILIHTSRVIPGASPSGRIAYSLLLSEDGGQNWSEVINDTLPIWRLRSISFDPFNPDRILGSTQWGGTWVATRPQASVSVRELGHLPAGHPDAGEAVKLYTLENDTGLSVSLTNFGAAIVSISMPDANGEIHNITQGFETLEQLVGPNPYYGATIGRYSGRIPGSEITVAEEVFSVQANDGIHSLHGGAQGFSWRFWSAHIEQTENAEDGQAILFRFTSPDADQGYPGTLEATVTYSLSRNSNQLTVRYSATSDKPTLVNLSNHTYFNLTGDTRSAHSCGRQLLTLYAKTYLQADKDWCASGYVLPVEGTEMDFRTPVQLGKRLRTPRTAPAYFDHGYVIDHAPSRTFTTEEGSIFYPAAELYDPVSRRHLQISTDQPVIHFYAGNSLHTVPSQPGAPAPERFSAISLEPMLWPIGSEIPLPAAILLPRETYTATIQYAFSIRP